MEADGKHCKCEFSRLNYISTKLLPIVIFAVEYIAVLIAEKLSLIIQHNLPGMNGQFYISDFTCLCRDIFRDGVYLSVHQPAVADKNMSQIKSNERSCCLYRGG